MEEKTIQKKKKKKRSELNHIIRRECVTKFIRVYLIKEYYTGVYLFNRFIMTLEIVFIADKQQDNNIC